MTTVELAPALPAIAAWIDNWLAAIGWTDRRYVYVGDAEGTATLPFVVVTVVPGDGWPTRPLTRSTPTAQALTQWTFAGRNGDDAGALADKVRHYLQDELALPAPISDTTVLTGAASMGPPPGPSPEATLANVIEEYRLTIGSLTP